MCRLSAMHQSRASTRMPTQYEIRFGIERRTMINRSEKPGNCSVSSEPRRIRRNCIRVLDRVAWFVTFVLEHMRICLCEIGAPPGDFLCIDEITTNDTSLLA